MIEDYICPRHTSVYETVFVFWLPQMLRPIFSDCVYDPKYPGVIFGTNNLVYLSIELPWTLTLAEESELSLSMEFDACYQV